MIPAMAAAVTETLGKREHHCPAAGQASGLSAMNWNKRIKIALLFIGALAGFIWVTAKLAGL
jgi:hypothetical protein